MNFVNRIIEDHAEKRAKRMSEAQKKCQDKKYKKIAQAALIASMAIISAYLWFTFRNEAYEVFTNYWYLFLIPVYMYMVAILILQTVRALVELIAMVLLFLLIGPFAILFIIAMSLVVEFLIWMVFDLIIELVFS